MLLNSLRFPTVNTEHIASIGIYINAVALRIVFCKHSFHSILSPYRPINHSLQKLEAFQSVHHVSFILCYMIFFVSAAASVGTEQMSTGHLVPLCFPLSEFVNPYGKI